MLALNSRIRFFVECSIRWTSDLSPFLSCIVSYFCIMNTRLCKSTLLSAGISVRISWHLRTARCLNVNKRVEHAINARSLVNDSRVRVVLIRMLRSIWALLHPEIPSNEPIPSNDTWMIQQEKQKKKANENSCTTEMCSILIINVAICILWTKHTHTRDHRGARANAATYVYICCICNNCSTSDHVKAATYTHTTHAHTLTNGTSTRTCKVRGSNRFRTIRCNSINIYVSSIPIRAYIRLFEKSCSLIVGLHTNCWNDLF